jgi:hypothetical protein
MSYIQLLLEIIDQGIVIVHCLEMPASLVIQLPAQIIPIKTQNVVLHVELPKIIPELLVARLELAAARHPHFSGFLQCSRRRCLRRQQKLLQPWSLLGNLPLDGKVTVPKLEKVLSLLAAHQQGVLIRILLVEV